MLYLARSPRGRSRDHLVATLWPDKEEARARHSLNEALRILRRCVGEALVTEGETVRLAGQPVRMDVDNIHQLDASELGLPFLDGVDIPDAPGFNDWLAGERRQIQAQQLTLLGERARQALREGDPASGRAIAERALALDPYHEPAARLVMRALALEGSRAGALAAYDRLHALFQRDLGIEPDGDTRALAGRIRQASARPGPPEGSPTREGKPPLLGDGRRQLAELSGLWEAAVRGAPRLAVVTGDPGTGKTRLIQELAGRAALDGGIASAGRAFDNDDPATVWGALLHGVLSAPELSGLPRAVLAGLSPLDPDIPTRFPASGGTEPVPLAEAIQAAVLAVAEQRPVLLALDDAHKAPAGVLQGLLQLAERAAARPVMVVIAGARSTPDSGAALDAVAARVPRDIPGVVLSTRLLDEAGLSELVQWAFPEYEPVRAARLVRRAQADTGGNPFLAVELVRALQAGLRLPDASARPWPAPHHTLDDTRPGDLPESLAAALRLRFRALSDIAQRALGAVAVLGGRTARATLARGVDLAEPELDTALDELEWSGWLTGDSRGYSFVTNLAREVVLQDMLTGGQQRRIRERARKPVPPATDA